MAFPERSYKIAVAPMIIFSSDGGLLSKTIQWFTNSTVSHVGITYYDETLGMQMVIHSTIYGFHIVPFSSFAKTDRIIEAYAPASPDDCRRMHMSLQKVARRIGASYDFVAIAGLVFVLLCKKWLQIKYKNPFKNPSRIFCSEMVSSVLMDMNAQPYKMFDVETTTPDDLLKYLQESQSFVKVPEFGN